MKHCVSTILTWRHLPIALVLAGLVAGGPSLADTQNNDDPGESLASDYPDITPPELLRDVQADYPPRAMEEGISAEVLLEIDIDADGQVEGVTVVGPAEPAGYGFDDAAVLAANQFVFSPAKEGDTPIPVRITYRYVFTLSPPDETEVDDTNAETVQPDDASLQQTAKPGTKRPRIVNFRGQLRERGTRLPLSGVTVTIFRGMGDLAIGYESITDKEGIFEFANLDADTWMLLAEPEGYLPLRTSETVEKNKRTLATYYVEKGSYNPYDVLVQEDRIRKEVNRTTLDMVEVERIPGSFGDVLTVVQNLPGVARTGPTAGNIVVRGSSPEDTLIAVDGITVPIIYHFGGLRSVIPLGMLDKLDFYPGNFTVEFGRATGGVVDVGIKRLNPEKPGGYADVNLIDTGLYLETPLGKKSAIAIAGRRSYIDGILNAAVPDSAPLNIVTAPRYYDYQLLGTVRPNRNHQLSLFLFGSDDRLEVLFDNPSDISPVLESGEARTSTTFYRSVLEHRYTPNETVENVLRTSSGRTWLYLGLGDQFYLDLNSYSSQVKNTTRLRLSDDIQLALGVDYLFTSTDVSIRLPPMTKEGEPGMQPDLDNLLFSESQGNITHSIGGFLQVEALLFGMWTLVPGFRYDYFSRVDKSVVAPRLNSRVAVADHWTVKGGVGIYHQEPAFDETDDSFGNPDLGLESAIHYSAGVEYQPRAYLTFDVTGFYKDMNDLVSRTDVTQLQDGTPVPVNFTNGGEGRVYGMEVMVRHDLANNFNGWISYTLSRALRKDEGQDTWRKFDYDQTHILNILGTLSLPKNWSLGFRWRLVSGSPTTSRKASVYNADDASYEPVFTRSNAKRLPPFHQLDIRFDKRWVFDKWMFTAYLDVQNIYNNPNITGYQYNYDASKKRPSQGLPLLPVLGVKGEF